MQTLDKKPNTDNPMHSRTMGQFQKDTSVSARMAEAKSRITSLKHDKESLQAKLTEIYSKK